MPWSIELSINEFIYNWPNILCNIIALLDGVETITVIKNNKMSIRIFNILSNGFLFPYCFQMISLGEGDILIFQLLVYIGSPPSFKKFDYFLRVSKYSIANWVINDVIKSNFFIVFYLKLEKWLSKQVFYSSPSLKTLFSDILDSLKTSQSCINNILIYWLHYKMESSK